MSVRDIIENYFESIDYSGDGYDVYYQLDADALAAELSFHIDVKEFDFEKAFTCPINKRNEAECLLRSCELNDFCRALRKEGYLCKK